VEGGQAEREQLILIALLPTFAVCLYAWDVVLMNEEHRQSMQAFAMKQTIFHILAEHSDDQ
jgi:hypothetical protein